VAADVSARIRGGISDEKKAFPGPFWVCRSAALMTAREETGPELGGRAVRSEQINLGAASTLRRLAGDGNFPSSPVWAYAWR
jgi:hypothetical protein